MFDCVLKTPIFVLDWKSWAQRWEKFGEEKYSSAYFLDISRKFRVVTARNISVEILLRFRFLPLQEI